MGHIAHLRKSSSKLTHLPKAMIIQQHWLRGKIPKPLFDN